MKIAGEDVTLSLRDPNAQDLLWEYAQRLRLGRDKTMDAEAEELECVLISLGFEPEAEAEDRLAWDKEEPSGSLFDDPESDED